MAPSPDLPTDPALSGARLQEFRQPDAGRLFLQTHRAEAGTAWWLISLHPLGGRFGRIARPGAKGGRPPAFCAWLRARLLGGRVEGLRLAHPQCLELEILRGAERFTLVLELNQRESNLLLLDGERRLLIAMRHPAQAGRKAGPGLPYEPPPRFFPYPEDIPLAERYPAAELPAALALERRWREREAAWDFADARQQGLRDAIRARKKVERRLAHLEADLSASQGAETWRRWGELLQIHRERLAPGLTELRVPDVFDPAQPAVAIPLDPRVSPAENIERLFKRYRRRRDAAGPVARRLAEARAEREAWAAVEGALREAGDRPELERRRSGLPPEASHLLERLLAVRPAPRGEGTEPRPVMSRLSGDGYTILVGRSRAENDQVTFRLSNGRDWWFHAQGLPGSHVVVRNPEGGDLPPLTLREAAWLAAYYSQGRASGRVEVDYTQRKHVRRIKGAGPGEVTFAQNRTVLVEITDGVLRQVLERVAE